MWREYDVPELIQTNCLNFHSYC